MSTEEQIEHLISKKTGQPFNIAESRLLGGGCINNAQRISDGNRSYFLKTNSRSFLEQFRQEKLALEEIVETHSIRVPQPIGIGSTDTEAFLILEFIEIGRPSTGSWELLGRGLAELHKETKAFFGWQSDNTIGSTPQPNRPNENWVDFFREQRLEHQFRLCRSKGLSVLGYDRLLDNLDTFFENYQPHSSLLHGDLWSGNAAFDKNGEPFIFDPCSYYGDRETDLAFSEFFGGFDRRFYDSYQECLPLDSGYAVRKDLYNLYHCLNHYYIFGGGYGQQAQGIVNRLLAVI